MSCLLSSGWVTLNGFSQPGKFLLLQPTRETLVAEEQVASRINFLPALRLEVSCALSFCAQGDLRAYCRPKLKCGYKFFIFSVDDKLPGILCPSESGIRQSRHGRRILPKRNVQADSKN
jgi:hypothetical protein